MTRTMIFHGLGKMSMELYQRNLLIMGTNLIEKINTTVEIDIYGFGGDGGGRFTGKGEYIGEILLQEPEKTKSKNDDGKNDDGNITDGDYGNGRE